MNLSPILDINKLSQYINEIKNRYEHLNKSINIEDPPKHFLTESITQLISQIILKKLLFDKEYWNKHCILLDDSVQIKKTIKSIEKKQIKGQGAFGTVYKVKSNLFIDKIYKKIDVDTVAIKIEKIKSINYFRINDLVNSIKISKYASKIKIGPKLYDTFVMIDDDNNIKIIKIFEYIEGVTFDKKKWKSPLEKKEMLKELKKIIRKMNKAGIIHHDLHAGNIMITKSNKIYIVDYDFSKFVENEEQRHVNYMNNDFDYDGSYIVNKKLVNYIYNNCINDGIIVLPL